MKRIWVHRHVHKTGGTSLRQVFKHLAVAKLVHMNHGWHCTPILNGSTNALQVFEMHTKCMTFNTEVLPVLEAVRAHAQVVLTTFVREPFQHSISAWLWTGKPSFASYNRTIDYWLPYNLQSNLLLRGDFDPYFMGNKEPKGSVYREFNAAMFEELLRILSRYTLVCPTTSMEQCTRYVLRRLRLPQVPVPHIAPAPHRSMGKPVNHTAANAEECVNIDCAELVAERTQFDGRLYQYAKQRVNTFDFQDRLDPATQRLHVSNISRANLGTWRRRVAGSRRS